MPKKYDDSAIQVLSDIEHIRQCPLMYISGTVPTMQMFEEIFSNALDEALNKYADTIHVDIDYDESLIIIEDNGRGIPQGDNPTLNIPTLEVIYSKLNAGGKYNRDNYQISGGLHGVGSCVVNAFSRFMEIVTWREKKYLYYRFDYGRVSDTKRSAIKRSDSGTKVRYQIDTSQSIFSEDKLSDHTRDIEFRVNLVASLYPKIKIYYQGNLMVSKSIKDFMDPDRYLFDDTFSIDLDDLKLVINWTDSTRYDGIYMSYCNLIQTRSGGDHVSAVEEALTSVYGQEILYGMHMVLSVTYPGVQFVGQSKDKSKSKEMKDSILEKVKSWFKWYLKKNPEFKNAIDKMVADKKYILSSRKAKRSVTRRSNKGDFLSALQSSGVSDCTTRDRSIAELCICEGLSAAGSLKQARDIVTQAVLPLRGKFINAYHTDLKTLLENKEAASLISSIDTGILDDCNPDKCRYGKILICTDSDPDGAHICDLLLAFFARVTPKLLMSGRIYVALPPLYGTTINGKFIPIRTEKEKNEYATKGYYVQRYKGLGELNPEQLRATALDPETRYILQVSATEEDLPMIERVMSGSSENRLSILREMGVYR